jgi:hypothetical protein
MQFTVTSQNYNEYYRKTYKTLLGRQCKLKYNIAEVKCNKDLVKLIYLAIKHSQWKIAQVVNSELK